MDQDQIKKFGVDYLGQASKFCRTECDSSVLPSAIHERTLLCVNLSRHCTLSFWQKWHQEDEQHKALQRWFWHRKLDNWEKPCTNATLFLPFSKCCKGKSRTAPLQAWSGPEGSRKLRFPDFMTTAQDGGKFVSLMHRPSLPPGNAPGTHFC